MYADEYLNKENRTKILDEDVLTVGKCVTAEISFAKFFEAIGGEDLESIITKNKMSHENK